MNPGILKISRARLIVDSEIVICGITILPVALNDADLNLGAVLSFERPEAGQGGGCIVGLGVVW